MLFTMRISKIVLTVLLTLIDLLQIGSAFLLTSKNYDYYSGQLAGAWRLYIFPTFLLLFLIAGIIAIIRKKDWGFVLLCVPLLLPIAVQLTRLNVSFLDTSAIDQRSQDSSSQFLQDSQQQ